MPDIDLPPENYRVKRKLSVRDGQMVVTAAGSAIALAYIFWRRNEFSPDILFGVTALFAAFGTGALVILLRRFI